jgi:hypothetical protein
MRVPSLGLALALVLVAPWPTRALAQSIDVSMTASQTRVAVGQTFVLEVRADVTGEELEELEPPELPGFEVLSRQVSRPFSFSFGLGRGRVVQSSTRYTFTLRALEPGTVRIEPARARVGGRTYRSQPVLIHVQPGRVPDAPAPDPMDPTAAPDTGALDGARFDAQAFVRTVVDKREAYVGEQLTVSILLYVRGGLTSSPAITTEATTDGFWVHDLLPASRTLEATRHTVQGVPFRAYELRRFAAFPLRPGELTIGAMEVQLQTGSMLGLLQGGRPVAREGVPVIVKAKPLPDANRQDVVVGSYRMETELDRDAVSTGDAITLRARVQGTGNLRDVHLALPDVPGLRILSPRIEDEVEATGDRVGGTRLFEWLIVAERPGRYVLPALGFDTFDPDAGVYRRVTSSPLTLEAVGAAPAAPDESGDARPAPGPDDPADDARFGPLRMASRLSRSEPPVWARPWYGVAMALPPFAWLAMLGLGYLRSHAEATGRKRAPARALRRRLAQARAHAEHGEARAFYGEVAQVLLHALAARLGEPVSGLTHAELRAHLLAQGMEPELVGRLVDELDGCDFARFSATGVAREEMARCLERVEALLARIARHRPGAGGEA